MNTRATDEKPLMSASEALLDALIMAARGGLRVTEIVIDPATYDDAVLSTPGARRGSKSFTLDGPTNPVLVRRGSARS